MTTLEEMLAQAERYSDAVPVSMTRQTALALLRELAAARKWRDLFLTIDGPAGYDQVVRAGEDFDRIRASQGAER